MRSIPEALYHSDIRQGYRQKRATSNAFNSLKLYACAASRSSRQRCPHLILTFVLLITNIEMYINLVNHMSIAPLYSVNFLSSFTTTTAALEKKIEIQISTQNRYRGQLQRLKGEHTPLHSHGKSVRRQEIRHY